MAFEHAEVIKSYVLPMPREGWRGLPLAEIRIGQVGILWVWALTYMSADMNAGGTSPLGLTSDHTNGYVKERYALEAAVTRLVEMAESDERYAKHKAWAQELLEPQQADLFA